jgi:hypothetical protein
MCGKGPVGKLIKDIFLTGKSILPFSFYFKFLHHPFCQGVLVNLWKLRCLLASLNHYIFMPNEKISRSAAIGWIDGLAFLMNAQLNFNGVFNFAHVRFGKNTSAS